MEENRELPTSEQVARRSYIRGTIEFLGGISLIATGIALYYADASPVLVAAGIVGTTLGYADLAHPVG